MSCSSNSTSTSVEATSGSPHGPRLSLGRSIPSAKPVDAETARRSGRKPLHAVAVPSPPPLPPTPEGMPSPPQHPPPQRPREPPQPPPRRRVLPPPIASLQDVPPPPGSPDIEPVPPPLGPPPAVDLAATSPSQLQGQGRNHQPSSVETRRAKHRSEMQTPSKDNIAVALAQQRDIALSLLAEQPTMRRRHSVAVRGDLAASLGAVASTGRARRSHRHSMIDNRRSSGCVAVCPVVLRGDIASRH